MICSDSGVSSSVVNGDEGCVMSCVCTLRVVID